MKILFNDIIQYSNAPEELKSSPLADAFNINDEIVIELDKQRLINSIGIGYTNSTFFVITFNDIDNTEFNINYTESGLYCMDKTVLASQIKIKTNGSYVGRIGAGIACNIPTAIMKEPSYNSTAIPRVTLSGQSIAGLGGHNFKSISLDSRYKITKEIIKELEDGKKYIGMGYPFFIDLTIERYKLSFSKLYANETNQQNLLFQSGITKFLYSRRFEFEERF